MRLRFWTSDCKPNKNSSFFKIHFRNITSSILIVLLVCIYSVISETQWVWSQNRVPHISGSSSSNLNNNNNNNNNNFGVSSSIPQSPQLSDLNNNNALPPGTIRYINSQGEARLIPGAVNFVSNALSSLGGGGGGGSAGGAGGAGGQGLLSTGTGLVSSLLQNIPQIASSALGLIFNRNPVGGGSSSSSNSPTTLPANVIPTFPNSPSGGGGDFPIIGGGGNGGGGGGIPSTSGNCRCIPLNQCFLPNRPNGDCAGGNSNCCATSSNTRAIASDDLGLNGLGTSNNNVRTPSRTDVRVGLLENIVRGSSSVFDDALDLVLQPWLTQEDQQKLANRIANSRSG